MEEQLAEGHLAEEHLVETNERLTEWFPDVAAGVGKSCRVVFHCAEEGGRIFVGVIWQVSALSVVTLFRSFFTQKKNQKSAGGSSVSFHRRAALHLASTDPPPDPQTAMLRSFVVKI